MLRNAEKLERLFRLPGYEDAPRIGPRESLDLQPPRGGSSQGRIFGEPEQQLSAVRFEQRFEPWIVSERSAARVDQQNVPLSGDRREMGLDLPEAGLDLGRARERHWLSLREEEVTAPVDLERVVA